MQRTKSKSTTSQQPSVLKSRHRPIKTNHHSNPSHMASNPSSTTISSTARAIHTKIESKQSRHHRPTNRINHITNQISLMSTSMSTTSKSEAVRIYTKDQPTFDNFDYVVVGAGSGGIASARRAASYGAKVAVINMGPLGGTCVNVGCVPKKLMWGAATVAEEMSHGESFGFDQLDKNGPNTTQFNWSAMKTKRDAYIHRLNGMYYRNSLRDGIYIFRGKGEFAMDANNEPDFTTLKIQPIPRNSIDCSDNYLDDFKVEEFKGKEVYVDEGFPVTIKINSALPVAASYQGSSLPPTDKPTPLTTTTNFINVAPGGYPTPSKFEGSEHVATSDTFFSWEKQPRRVCSTGAGYIGVELSQVLAALGSHVSYIIRGNTVLRHFDATIVEALMPQLEKQCNMVKGSVIGKVVKLTGEEVSARGLSTGERPMNEIELQQLFTPMHVESDTNTNPENIYGVWTKSATAKKDESDQLSFLGYYDAVLSAVGRVPGTHIMNVPTSATNAQGHVQVDQMGTIVDPKAKNIFAVGDVLGKSDLTPVAISFGRRLSDWLFGGKPQNPLVWHDPTKDTGLAIPTVVFSHPPIGTCGLTTAEAEEVYGKDKIRVWNAKFVPMYCALHKAEEKFQAVTKIITVREFCNYTQQDEDVVIGIHLLFPGADEAMQGFAIAVANRLPKSFIDNTIAIHPSASEELVLFR